MSFSVRQMQEKCIEENLDIYQCLIDLAKAVDTLNRAALLRVLEKLGCPHIFHRLYLVSSWRYECYGHLSWYRCEPISTMNGVKQGCVLVLQSFFAVVFKIALKTKINSIYIRYRMSGKLFNISHLKEGSKVSTVIILELLYVDGRDS